MNIPSLCSADDSVLVVVDLQIRLLAAMAEADRAHLVKHTETLLQAAGALEIPVLYTEQYPKGLGPTVPALVERLPAMALCFEKTAFSCCAAEGFLSALKASGRGQVVLVGQEVHVCVLQTALELLALGFRVFVVEDGVCSRAQGHKHNALARLREAGAVVTNVESVLFEWLRDAAHPEFKTISQWVR
ncbi:Nicotinamidase-related amidase [Methylomagnum ishizawai]|uniref:Nicotinamidase-related amidase n=1 Tax=Methylomagnum ishizawai TaxID=1760988 RepID=A0A1Y6CYL1_9GAMM|nr:isochorismatase family protein [Methylomagnum ishizawai]SMF95320.1 Nicotinamidase-related amidase [Methylomagnum ishizawai]